MMKKCLDCNVEMVEAKYYGKPRWMDRDHDIDKFFVTTQVNKNANFFSAQELLELRARICPKCGKVESYVNLNDQINNNF